jgi:transmembrane sensor
MESRVARLNRIAPRRIRARAALWVTELHGPGRDAELESRVRQWIAQDPRNAAAFELATEAWQRSGNLPADLSPQLSAGNAGRRVSHPRLALAAMAALAGVIAVTVYLLRDDTLATGAREQRTVELADGTEVSLNANTRIAVQFDAHTRKVTLSRGEALFNVVKHQARPFVVVVGDRKVIATGTSFLVRVGDSGAATFDVTLVEGRVTIEPVAWPDIPPRKPVSGLKVLDPGQRLRFKDSAHNVADHIDSPSIDKVTAWRRGELIFDDTSLADAAAEFNRYDAGRIEIDGDTVGRLRVGGVFRIGDAASFAAAMSNAHHLRILQRGTTIVLVEPSAPAPQK